MSLSDNDCDKLNYICMSIVNNVYGTVRGRFLYNLRNFLVILESIYEKFKFIKATAYNQSVEFLVLCLVRNEPEMNAE